MAYVLQFIQRIFISVVVFVFAFIVISWLLQTGDVATAFFSFIIALMVFFSNRWKTARDQATQPAGEIKNDELASELDTEARTETEAERVSKEVQKAIERAEEKHLKELISDLYFQEIKYYPFMIDSDTGRESVPSLVTRAIERKGNEEQPEDERKEIEITLCNTNYKFVFNERHSVWDEHVHGLLELFRANKRVFAINLSLEVDWDVYWRPFGIKALIEGEWIDDFQELKKAHDIARKKRAIEKADDPERIEKLKRDFGID